MGRIDAPNLIALSVAVVLIVAGAAATGGQADSQLVERAERVAVDG